MLLIQHRINSIEQAVDLPPEYGGEVDVRYHNDEIILEHDPLGHHKTQLLSLNHFLTYWNCSGPLILNVKTEGIERRCIELMQKHQVENWFFLDLSMPFFVQFTEIAQNNCITNFGPNNLAVRFSDKEPIEYAMAFKGKAGWVWVDCFLNLPLNKDTHSILRDAGFKLCLVSPELQKHDVSRIAEFRDKLTQLEYDAVCTKRPDLWLD